MFCGIFHIKSDPKKSGIHYHCFYLRMCQEKGTLNLHGIHQVMVCAIMYWTKTLISRSEMKS